MEKKIYVYENWSSELPRKMGTLFVNVIRGSEHSSFQFEADYAEYAYMSQQYILDPELTYAAGRQYPLNGKSAFGVFSDSSPDRWGRKLIKCRERLDSDKDTGKASNLLESDYLLGVFDECRMGALHFALADGGEFLSNDNKSAVPLWAELSKLEQAVSEIEKDKKCPGRKWLDLLLPPGAALGGARPKATVRDSKGNLWIAKFPSLKDTTDVGAWEKVAHDLAGMCGLNVPESKLEKLSKQGSAFLVKRFDRNGNSRIHFASAMTMLGREDGDNDAGYPDIADFIKAHSVNAKEDLLELWKRIVFSMAISNVDDHLRNHGFILHREGWRLSPLYDVNPVPYGEKLALKVDDNDSSVSVDLAVETSQYYDIERDDAIAISADILSTVKHNWEALASKYGLSRGEIEKMRPAFRESEKHGN